MKASESLETRLIDSALRAWKFNADRIDKFFGALSPEQLEQEIAPGRNRLIYLWRHIAALNDGLFPLMGLGPSCTPKWRECSSQTLTGPPSLSILRTN
jgi:hypothetical protein